MIGYIDIETVGGIIGTVTDWFPMGEGMSIASAWKLDAIHKLLFLQAADVEPVKRGQWRQTDEPNGWEDIGCAECSYCGNSFALGDWDFDDFCADMHYCPNCGARMCIAPGRKMEVDE